MPSTRRAFLKSTVAVAAISGLGSRASAASGDGLPSEVVFQRRVPVRHEVDVFVAGGGPAGVAAATAAARQGASVFLAEHNNCLGGMGTAGLLPVFMKFSDGVNMLAGGVGEEIHRRLKTIGGTGPDFNRTIRAEALKRLYDEMLLEAEVIFQLQTDLIAVEADEGKVSSAVLAAKSGLFAVQAKMFLDCTGDGDLAAWAGAPFEKGDEHGEMMPGTLCSLWAGIDWTAVYQNRVGKQRDHYRLEEAFRDKVFSLEDRHLPGMYRVGWRLGGGNIGHAFGLDGTDERSITKAMIGARKSLLEYERYYKKYLKGFGQMELAATAAQLGVRETRRILGDYVLDLEDFKSRATFDDEIGRYSYPVDIHPSKPDQDSYNRFLKSFRELRYGKGESYGIPYRCLSPKKLTNVLVAGRCISTDRYMQSSVRVMPGCFITGQAIGVAAAIAVERGCDVRGLPVPELQRRLKVCGAYLPNF